MMYVEFLGIPRERAGISELQLEARTLGEVLALVATRFPRFGELLRDGRLHPSIAANLNANQFISDPRTPLGADDRLLILSADAGG
jgi:molybdopterin converting factor small subunit